MVAYRSSEFNSKLSCQADGIQPLGGLDLPNGTWANPQASSIACATLLALVRPWVGGTGLLVEDGPLAA